MSIYVPGGTATGPDWQYRIERNGLYTAWLDWAIDLKFDTDPDGGDLRTGVLYWAYARNSVLPSDEPGSLQQPFAASFEITDSGRIIPGSVDGNVELGESALLSQIAALSDTEKMALLTILLSPLLTTIGAPAKALLCRIIETCDTVTPPATSFIFVNPVDYEAVPIDVVETIDVEILDSEWEGTDGDSIDVELSDSEWEGESANPVPTVNHHQADQLISASGDQYYDLNADLFADPGDTQSLLVRKQDPVTNSVSALPTGISFGFDAGTGLRRITVLGSVADQVLRMFVNDLDSVEQNVWDIHQLTINRAQVRIMPDINWATHSNDFSFNFFTEEGGPSDGYAFIGGTGTWSWSAGQLCQSATGDSSDQRMLQFSTSGSQNSLNADQTLALVKPTAFNGDSRIGIGLRFASGVSDGYHFGFKDGSSVQFLHNAVGYGPTAPFASSLNTWYFARMKYEETGSSTARLSGKIWNALQAEPEAWTIVWEDQPRKAGYPVLSGGYNGSKGCFGPWYDSKTLTP